ncbi:unnamed protein product [Closterium sp. NIES-64]|nr:unnamed protein product [Closterium sp. NIES-64]
MEAAPQKEIRPHHSAGYECSESEPHAAGGAQGSGAAGWGGQCTQRQRSWRFKKQQQADVRAARGGVRAAGVGVRAGKCEAVFEAPQTVLEVRGGKGRGVGGATHAETALQGIQERAAGRRAG